MDFETMKADIISALKNSETFKNYDFDYEGSNISVLIELIAYLGDVNTFYLNKLAKEMYIDTVELYENAHRLAKLSGYTPLGYRSASTYLKVILTQGIAGQHFSLNDQINIPQFKEIKTIDGQLTYLITNSHTETITLDFTDSGLASDLVVFEFDVDIKEGKALTYTYKGTDIINNRIELPFLQFDHTQASDTETSF
jgi:hypothetical protein